MAGNSIDYLREYGNLSFAEVPFCDADALILAQLSYLRFDGLVPGPGRRRQNGWGLHPEGRRRRGGWSFRGGWSCRENVRGRKRNAAVRSRKGPAAERPTLRQVGERMDPEQFFDRWYERQNRELWDMVSKSPRFLDVECGCYRSRLDEKEETQFAAIVFFPKGCEPVAVFRGTDDSLVGWKEDFNLSFQNPVPAQRMSAAYLNQAGSGFRGPFSVCGHSKGGNLAIYASVCANAGIRRRIRTVYSLDGPGFLPKALPEGPYEEMKGRIRRILPASSIIGMLLLNPGPYETVRSRAAGVMQHDSFSWEIENGRFVLAKDVEERQRRRNDVLNRWIFSLPEEERELFVDALFGIVRKTGAATLTGFAENWGKNLRICLKEIRGMDQETGKRMRRILRELIEIYRSAAGQERKAERNRDGKDRISH